MCVCVCVCVFVCVSVCVCVCVCVMTSYVVLLAAVISPSTSGAWPTFGRCQRSTCSSFCSTEELSKKNHYIRITCTYTCTYVVNVRTCYVHVHVYCNMLIYMYSVHVYAVRGVHVNVFT